jgi:xanthine dehydrogenase accessory factor
MLARHPGLLPFAVVAAALHTGRMTDTGLPDPILQTALNWHRAGLGGALATVVSTWGSAPRPVGAQMAVSGRGDMAGSVSGGCVEGAVVLEARAALADGTPRLLRYGISDDTAFAAGLACGGTIEVMVEPIGDAPQALPDALLAAWVAAQVVGKAVALETHLGTWTRRILQSEDDALVATRLARDQSGRDGDALFIAVHNPPLRLIVVGAVHIAQALVPMARACGYVVKLIDPRTSFAAAARFPDDVVVGDWPDAAVADLQPDARTAVVTLTHDPKLDDPAILAALRTKAFYIGCLGSKRTHAARLDRLRDHGAVAVDVARLHAPVGLDIGATSPGEIAISILAEMTLALRRGS